MSTNPAIVVACDATDRDRVAVVTGERAATYETARVGTVVGVDVTIRRCLVSRPRRPVRRTRVQHPVRAPPALAGSDHAGIGVCAGQ